MERNCELAKGYPYVGVALRPPLAVVGGGPSINDHVETLRNWRGDVWACGSPYLWCVRNGIDATYFNIDPGAPFEGQVLVSHGARAILSTTVNPAVFASCKSVEVFDLSRLGDNHGVTTATAAPHLALSMGYTDISIFGCESCYAEGESHAYDTHKDVSDHLRMRIVCNGEAFITIPSLFMQAELLSKIIRLSPVFKERSGGLLRAMVEDDDYDCTHATRALHKAFGTDTCST